MEIRIGIAESPQTLEIELDPDTNRDDVMSEVERVLSAGAGTVLKLTDRKGKETLIPGGRISFVEVGSGDAERRIGFGA